MEEGKRQEEEPELLQELKEPKKRNREIELLYVRATLPYVRNVTKIPLFSPNFFLTLIIYGLLSYSVRLYCANIYTPLPFFSFLSLRFSDQEDKASRFTLLGRPRTTVLQVLVVIILRT